jgi:exopolysaccharide biosynthesis polyprenyl glycosylphosphotransferase
MSVSADALPRPHRVASTDPADQPRLSLVAHEVTVETTGGLGMQLSLPVAPERSERRRIRLDPKDLRAVVVGADCLAVFAALFVAGTLMGRFGFGERIAVLTAVLAGAALGRLYRRDDLALSKAALTQTSGLAQVSVIATLTLAVAGSADRNAAWFVGFGALLLAMLMTFRVAAQRLSALVGAAERCLVIGEPERFERFERQLGTSASRAEIVEWIDLDHVGSPDNGRLTVERLIFRHKADRVIVLADDPVDRTAQIARRARNAGVMVTVCPRILETFGGDLLPELVGGSVALTAPSAELGAIDHRLKRAFDVLGAGALLLATMPSLALMALAIKLTSRGPVLFWQTRVGRDGRRFRIAKFRTMVADAEALKDDLRHRNEAEDGLFKMADDPRVTTAGRLLRRTSLDELPQLINVIKGDMSLVGPRPLVCDEDVLIEGWHRDRLRLAPGMTGPWQVAGSARVPLKDMVLLDHHYVSNWSVWTDLSILFQTASFVFRRRGL